MILGVPREIKPQENRVALTPSDVSDLILEGHKVLVQENAGLGSGFSNEEYRKSGAKLTGVADIFARGELILKVKEPQPEEFALFRENQGLFTYLHLAPNPMLTEFLRGGKVSAFAYETLCIAGKYPLLAPMSEIAGRMAPMVGAYLLQKPSGGAGILPSGASGVLPAKCLIVGAGVVGSNAARIALGLGMDTTVINIKDGRLRKIDDLFNGRVKSLVLTEQHLADELSGADLVIGSVLIPGKNTPQLIQRDHLKAMKTGAVLVDVCIDQGGISVTSRPTTHEEPTYVEENILHYCVPNMPGAYPRTATQALTSSTLAYIKQIAGHGIEKAAQDSVLKTALNTHQGKIMLDALK